MIKLKNGYVVPYNKDIDVFFQDLIESMVREARASVHKESGADDPVSRNELFLKELMDNCIYVTHQIFELSKQNEEFARFIITGFIFNGIICSLSALDQDQNRDSTSKDKEKMH